jgi:hypothetical protein
LVLATVTTQSSDKAVGVIVEKNKFHVEDNVIYCVPGVWVPTSIMAISGQKKIVNGTKGVVITARIIKGVKSEGVIMPYLEDIDYSVICVYDPSANIPLSGHIKGDLPAFCHQTGSKRFKKDDVKAKIGKTFEITEKLEGTSMTVFRRDGVFGVCSHHKELKPDPVNAYWHVATLLQLEKKLIDHAVDNIEINGELVGPFIQGNIYNLSCFKFYVFNVHDLKYQTTLPPNPRYAIVKFLDLLHVPVINPTYMLVEEDLDHIPSLACGHTLLETAKKDTFREGLFYKQLDDEFSFKVISSSYLEKSASKRK